MRHALPAILAVAVSACAALPAPEGKRVTNEPMFGPVRETGHRGADDLLSAGLGLGGLRSPAPAFADPLAPTPAELRRRAIHANWNGIADLGPLGGFGSVYGAVPNVPGREFTAFARLPGASQPFRVLVQVPDDFDAKARCLVVAASSGSRGIHGAIALAGAWGLPRGCAVAYTDKGAGTGYFDLDEDSGVALDGTRARRGAAELEFEPAKADGATGVAIKHAHSGDNPEADWGRHVLAAARFGLAMLDRAFPAQAPFTPANVRVLATGVSNGGGAALQAAGIDDGLLDGVVALAPNVHVASHGRALYDYDSEAALLLPCALLDARFDAIPFARDPATGAPWRAWQARCSNLHAAGFVAGEDNAARARDALDRLLAAGWSLAGIETAASSTAFDLWRAVAATYASAYLRAAPGAMPCGLGFGIVNGSERADLGAVRAAWWSDASGIPPGAEGALSGGIASGDDMTWPSAECLRRLWSGDDAASRTLRESVAATAAQVPRADLPVIVAHGEADGLLPIGFGSDAWIAAARAVGRAPVYWRVPHAQHFDAFLKVPGFGDRYVPLLPYGYAALDAMRAHLASGAAAPASRTFATRPRGAGALEVDALDLPEPH